DLTLILSNLSAGIVGHHASIPGKGLRRMLIKQGFRVLLIDEFKISTWCLYCGGRQLKKFLDVNNPRPHRRAETPSCPQIINCNLAACLNFRNVVDKLREHGSVPECFMRPRHIGNVLAMAPDDGSPTRHQRTE
ncbi:hypothetical protein COEREDRAFT_44376, partial [Coemansia reversa NRRL 1564]